MDVEAIVTIVTSAGETPPGRMVDLPDDEARRLIAIGHARMPAPPAVERPASARAKSARRPRRQ